MSQNNFSASSFWIWKFKINNSFRSITSRKITKWITKKQLDQEENIHETVELFAASFLQYFEQKGYQKCQVFNSYQSGFNLEVHCGRTLEFKGVKTVQFGSIKFSHDSLIYHHAYYISRRQFTFSSVHCSSGTHKGWLFWHKYLKTFVKISLYQIDKLIAEQKPIKWIHYYACS